MNENCEKDNYRLKLLTNVNDAKLSAMHKTAGTGIEAMNLLNLKKNE